MKIKMSVDGNLIITPEKPIECYALKRFMNEFIPLDGGKRPSIFDRIVIRGLNEDDYGNLVIKESDIEGARHGPHRN